jgi:hypothetical protein
MRVVRSDRMLLTGKWYNPLKTVVRGLMPKYWKYKWNGNVIKPDMKSVKKPSRDTKEPEGQSSTGEARG